MTINSISFGHTSGDGVMFDQLTVYMGPSTSDVLDSNFDDNYSGAKTTVFNQANPSFTPSGGWVTVSLDTPYFFNGSDNLIIEIEWPSGGMEVYTGHWVTAGSRSMDAPYGSSSGNLLGWAPHLLISGTMNLSPSTFGSIKASF